MNKPILKPGWHIGTSGWSYKHWDGVFYPENVKPARYLEYFVTRFDCVELNSCFYHLPRESTIHGWMERTPDTFIFCPKLSRLITHQLKLTHCEEPLNRFFNLFDKMKKKIGPILIQIAPDLHFDEEFIIGFLEILKTDYSDYQFAFEVRHKSWINDTFFNILSSYGAAFVIADSGKRYPGYEAITADFVYLRLHGREVLYASDYSDEELLEYACKISRWLEADKEVWIFFNNDYHAFAIKNAQRLIELIQQQE